MNIMNNLLAVFIFYFMHTVTIKKKKAEGVNHYSFKKLQTIHLEKAWYFMNGTESRKLY